GRVPGGAWNVIPGGGERSVDIRADRDELRDAAYASVVAESESIAARRQVAIEWHKGLDVASVRCSTDMQQRWAESIGRVPDPVEAPRLPSGAGHDAMVMAQIT